MGTYLDKLKNTITETQARQITNLLVKQKQSGDIKNLEEFKSRLSELTNLLLAEHITPTLKLFFGVANNLIDSETFDFMIDRIRDDLETAFLESNSLSEVLDAHKNIINNVLLQAIKLGIAELEAKVSTYEFLATNNSGFDNAQFNTFKASQNARAARTDKDANVLFRDPKTQGIINDDVTLDLVSESILLPLNILNNVIPKNVRQVFDAVNTQSVDNVSFESSDIRNIIDGSSGTFWVYSILQKVPLPNILAKIELDLGNYFDINFVNIEAATIFPMTLERIEYIDSNNSTQTLTVGETIFNTAKNIYFNRITTKKIFLVFSQKHALEVQYVNKTTVDNYDKAVLNQGSDIDTDSISQKIRDLITSSRVIQDALLISPIESNSKPTRLYDYSIGFDNIRVGYSTFTQKGIFVSAPITIDSLGQLAIKTKEKRPVELSGVLSNTSDTYPIIDTGQYFHSSVEYWATIYNFESNDQLIDINQIPLLPIGATRVYHENLVLSNTVASTIPNVGTLMFYTRHFNTDDLNDISVYRNGTLLEINTDWIIDDTLTNDVISPSGKPNIVSIRILHPTSTDFFTVSYTPLISNSRAHPVEVNNISLIDDSSLIKIIDLVGDGSIRTGLNNILYISNKKNAGKTTAYSKIYLVIVIRRGSSDENLTASVDEYLLISSSNNSEKFSG